MRTLRLIPIPMVLLFGPFAWASSSTITSTGFFADLDCVKGRVATGIYTPSNPECAKKCLEKGSPLVFLDAQAKAMYTVKGYSDAIGDLGYRMEVTGTVDDAAKTLTI